MAKKSIVMDDFGKGGMGAEGNQMSHFQRGWIFGLVELRDGVYIIVLENGACDGNFERGGHAQALGHLHFPLGHHPTTLPSLGNSCDKFTSRKIRVRQPQESI
jgi:hypothetical protein